GECFVWPHYFLCCIDFAGSEDIVVDLPSRFLDIYVDDEEFWASLPTSMHFVWKDDPAEEAPRPEPPGWPRFSGTGVKCRVRDYPDALARWYELDAGVGGA